MPVVTIALIEGYDERAKERLGQAVTDAVRLVVPAPPEAVTVMCQEIAADGYMRGRERRRPAPPRTDPETVVRDYLGAMERRDLDAARAFLAPGFAMVFPGGARFTTPGELVAWAKGRYRSIGKTYDRFAAQMAGDRAVVWCEGTLHGEWPDGAPFAGIRFVDRFEIEDDRIVRQDVWNDLAEARAASVEAPAASEAAA